MTTPRSAVTAIGIDDLPALGDVVLTMGVFDGVHAGHRAMLDAARTEAERRGAEPVAFAFDPPPDEVLRPETRVARLAPLHVVLERIRGSGITHAVPLRFDGALRALAPDDFLAAVGRAMRPRCLVMSPESAFGRGRSGTVDRMREIGADQGFEVRVVDPVAIDGAAVSSSRIRDLVERGDVAGAARLGATPYLEGRVVEGDHRGRELGFPTANLAFDYHPALPANGIYLGRVAIPERNVGPRHPALVSIGVRPTFHDDGARLVEVYLLDFEGDLYGTVLQLELSDRLRDEQRFDGVEPLVAQMRRDEAAARRILGSSDGGN